MRAAPAAVLMLLAILALTAVSFGKAAAAVGAAASKHNMTDVQGYGLGEGVCASCHKPHYSSGKRAWAGDKETAGDGQRNLNPAKAESLDQTAGPGDYPGIYLCLDCHSASASAPSWANVTGHKAKRAKTHSTREMQAAGYNTKYGSFTQECSDCHDPHQYWDGSFGGGVNGYMIRPAIKAPDGTVKTVVFSRMTGHNSFADGDSTVDGVCEVCHTIAIHNAGENCSRCHSHDGGFAGKSCDACHGEPPTSYGTLVGREANPGPSPTGAATAGKHAFHTLSTSGGAGYGCDVCHRGGMDNDTADDMKLDVRFSAFGVSTSGGFDGFTPVNGYSFSPNNTTGGTLSCRNTYCHGNFSGGNRSNSPVWDDASTGDCGTCHPVSSPGLQDHGVHISDAWGPQAACDDCHPVNSPFGNHTGHVNGRVDFRDDAATLDDTTVCNVCHGCSASTKPLWGSQGYRGQITWCESCHDGSSTVNTAAGTGSVDVAAPDVVGDGISYGFDVTGHGNIDAGLVCVDCHNWSSAHIDGSSPTYQASSGNYKTGYRLSMSNTVPLLANYSTAKFALCYFCHIESRVVGMPSGGVPSAMHVHTPLSSDKWYTNFRNMSTLLGKDAGNHDNSIYDVPTNIHWNHLDDYGSSQREAQELGGKQYDSDHNGTADSYVTCETCHNPHGTRQPAMVMDAFSLGTFSALENQSLNPSYRWLGSSSYITNRCTEYCHLSGDSPGTSGTRWYREPSNLSTVFGMPVGLSAEPLP